MKKTFISFLLAALMIVPMASAVSSETYDADLDSSAAAAADGENSTRAVARVEPTGLKLYAMYETANGRTEVYKTHYIYFRPENGQSFIRYNVGPTIMQQFKDKLSTYGITPVGWCVEAGYNIQAYRAVRWDIYKWTASGKGPLQGKSASLGTNTFEVQSLIADETTPYYKLGITGNLIYYPTYSSQDTKVIELSIQFERSDPGIQIGVIV